MKTSNLTPIQLDLARRTHERLNTWMLDTFDLFEMAGEGDAMAANVCMTELICLVALFADAADIGAQEVAEAIMASKKKARARSKG